jgi:hypothetical protein
MADALEAVIARARHAERQGWLFWWKRLAGTLAALVVCVGVWVWSSDRETIMLPAVALLAAVLVCRRLWWLSRGLIVAPSERWQIVDHDGRVEIAVGALAAQVAWADIAHVHRVSGVSASAREGFVGVIELRCTDGRVLRIPDSCHGVGDLQYGASV